MYHQVWSSTDDDGTGLIINANGLREHAREILVRAAYSKTSHSRSHSMWTLTSAFTLPGRRF